MKTRLLLWGLLLSVVSELYAQDSPATTFGAWLSMETQSLPIERVQQVDPNISTVWSKRAATGPGGGVFLRWNIVGGWALQPALGLSTLRHRVFFQGAPPVDYRFTSLDLPLHIVWTNNSDRFLIRPSVVLGGRLGVNLARQTARDQLVLLQEWVAIDLGIGIEIHTKRLIIRPEVLYAYGMNNLHDYTNTSYDPLIGRIQRDRLSVRLSCMRVR